MTVFDEQNGNGERMKITIMGYSGAGKSTLARKLGEIYGENVLHLDQVYWMPGWNPRPDEERKRIVNDFLDSHTGWVIDGNYQNICYDRRLEEADMIILLLFNRFDCYFRARKRFKTYKGKSRPDMTEGCNEKIDAEFTKWIFFGGRTAAKRENYRKLCEKYAGKTVVLKKQRDTDRYLAGCTTKRDQK